MKTVRSLAALALSAALLTGCNDGGSEADDDPTEPSSQTDGTATDEPTDPTSGTAEPSVRPASGELVTGPSFTLHAPAGWTVDTPLEDYFQITPASASEMTIINVSQLSVNPYDDLDAAAQARLDDFRGDGHRGRRLADVTIAGKPAYHLRGDSTLGTIDTYAVLRPGGVVVVEISWDADLTDAAERQGIIDSVLASWQWT